MKFSFLWREFLGFEDGSKNFPKLGKGLCVMEGTRVGKKNFSVSVLVQNFGFVFYYLKC